MWNFVPQDSSIITLILYLANYSTEYTQINVLGHMSKLMYKNISDSIANSSINGYKLFDVIIQLVKSSNCKSKPVARLGDRP